MFILDLTASVRCPLSPLGQSLVTVCSNDFTLKLTDDNVTEGFLEEEHPRLSFFADRFRGVTA